MGGEFIHGHFPRPSEASIQALEAEYSREETRKALMSMGPLKAPGPNGFQPLFFQKTWEVTSSALHVFTKKVLEEGIVPSDAAEALSVVIPKEANPASMRSFRPLSLCNVPLKVASKMIVHRLKGLLQTIITPNQSSFIPGRHITDNIVTCQELVHSLQYTKAECGGMIVKLDFEKAYDRMEWSFVEATLRDVPLPNTLITAIMSILHSRSCRLVWNGECTDVIKQTRGLRQGDPLSPYWFVLCMDRLSQWINA